MPTVADVMRRYGPAYIQRFSNAMPASHRKVIDAIMFCRTGKLGYVSYACSSCGHRHVMGQSCGDRHCPTCQQERTKAWLTAQTQRLLPCPYFLITFTVPSELHDLVRSNSRVCYDAMFEASSRALKKLAADPKHIGTSKPGFFGVLHTWGRTLSYHPHVHYVVPGGGVSDDGQRWLPSRPNFYVPMKALSTIYRGKFRDLMAQAGLLNRIDPAVWRKDWVVDSQAVGDGERTLKYLAPYVFRVAISDHRIVSCDNGQVTFGYRKSGSNRWRRMTLDAMEFIRRFLQHTLPKGFMKVRHYGFLNPNSAHSVDRVRVLVAIRLAKWAVCLAIMKKSRTSHSTGTRPRPRCPKCGEPMTMIGQTFGPSYQDSG